MLAHRLSRRVFLLLAASASTTAILAACSPKAPPTQAAKETPKEVKKEATTEQKPQTTEKPATTKKAAEELLGAELVPGDPNHARGWKTTLPDIPAGIPWSPPVVVRTTTRIDAATQFWGGDTIDNNPRTRFYKKLFGIEYKIAYTWASGDEAEQKANLAMASGDLPDLFTELGTPIFYRLVDGKMLQDITETYEAVADKKQIKEPLEWGNHILWTYVEINGRKMGFPRTALIAQDEAILFIRQDWLEKLGLKDPTTIDELGEVAKAFVKNNLGSGPAGSTIGVCLGKYLSGWYGGVDPIFGGYGVQPTRYVNSFFTDDGKGGLKYDGIQPEMKQALTLLRKWYTDGIIAKDFFTKDTPALRTEMEGNRCGIVFTHPGGGTSWCAQGSMKNDPNARWKWIDVPAGPIRKGKNWFNPCHTGTFCFRKGYQHVDKVFIQANFDAEIVNNPGYRYHGFRDYDYVWKADNTLDPGKGGHHPFGIIYTKGGTNVSPLTNVQHIKFRQEYGKSVPREKWDAMMERLLADPTGVNQLADTGWLFMSERTNLDGIKNRYLGQPTATMTERWAGLDKLTQEAYIGLINGDLSLDAFEKYARDWKAQGGDTILGEVNEWWKTHKWT